MEHDHLQHCCSVDHGLKTESETHEFIIRLAAFFVYEHYSIQLGLYT